MPSAQAGDHHVLRRASGIELAARADIRQRNGDEQRRRRDPGREVAALGDLCLLRRIVDDDEPARLHVLRAARHAPRLHDAPHRLLRDRLLRERARVPLRDDRLVRVHRISSLPYVAEYADAAALDRHWIAAHPSAIMPPWHDTASRSPSTDAAPRAQGRAAGGRAPRLHRRVVVRDRWRRLLHAARDGRRVDREAATRHRDRQRLHARAAALAISANAIAEAAPGRFALGIGAGSSVIVEQWGGVPFECAVSQGARRQPAAASRRSPARRSSPNWRPRARTASASRASSRHRRRSTSPRCASACCGSPGAESDGVDHQLAQRRRRAEGRRRGARGRAQGGQGSREASRSSAASSSA